MAVERAPLSGEVRRERDGAPPEPESPAADSIHIWDEWERGAFDRRLGHAGGAAHHRKNIVAAHEIEARDAPAHLRRELEP